MRTCLGIFCGIIFLLASSFFIFTVNLDKTIYSASFDKKAINNSGIYKSVPETLTAMVSSGEITTSENQQLSPATKQILIDTINNVLTPETLKKHSESLLDQTLSDQIVVTEDLSDINDAVNSKLGKEFSQMMGVAVSSNPENSFVPKTITFDKSKSQIGQSVIHHKKALWISLALTILFLILLFFTSADNYKSRFKWVAGFLVAASFFALANFLIFRLFGFNWIVNLINSNTEQAWIANISTQIMNILAQIKTKISFYYLVEFIFLTFLTILFFIIAAIIPAKKMAEPVTPISNQPIAQPANSQNNVQGTANAPKKA